MLLRYGIWDLFDEKRTECIDPLLTALEGKKFLSNRLKEIAIQAAFKAGAKHHNSTWVERFFDHPAVTPDVYANGLIWSGDDNAQDPIFKWLLAEADRADLQALQSHEYYKYLSPEFRAAIEQALPKANPEDPDTAPLKRPRESKKFSVISLTLYQKAKELVILLLHI